MGITPAFGLYFALVILVTAAAIGLSALLGERHRERATAEPYESGVLPTGSARVRLSAQFYLVAMLFVIFDLEAVFLFAWAVALRETAWTGFGAAMVFVLVLVVGLLYEWRQGALDWVPRGRRPSRRTRADALVVE